MLAAEHYHHLVEVLERGAAGGCLREVAQHLRCVELRVFDVLEGDGPVSAGCVTGAVRVQLDLYNFKSELEGSGWN